MDNLALKIRVVHHIEVHDAEGTHAGGGKIKRQRRAEPARADTEHTRRFQLLLPLHADLWHDQVARVTENLFIAKSNGFGFSFG